MRQDNRSPFFDRPLQRTRFCTGCCKFKDALGFRSGRCRECVKDEAERAKPDNEGLSTRIETERQQRLAEFRMTGLFTDIGDKA